MLTCCIKNVEANRAFLPPPLFFPRVLRDNPLVCSCDLYWLQEWQRNDRGDLDNQMLSCFSDNQEVPLNSLVIDNCSEFGFHFDILHVICCHYIWLSHPMKINISKICCKPTLLKKVDVWPLLCRIMCFEEVVGEVPILFFCLLGSL